MRGCVEKKNKSTMAKRSVNLKKSSESDRKLWTKRQNYFLSISAVTFSSQLSCVVPVV